MTDIDTTWSCSAMSLCT